jgi:hypothetical protein
MYMMRFIYESSISLARRMRQKPRLDARHMWLETAGDGEVEGASPDLTQVLENVSHPTGNQHEGTGLGVA